jgi:UDP-N-acetylmuramate dehydrogenase
MSPSTPSIQSNVSLKALNTFQVSCIARYFTQIQSTDELKALAQHPLWKTEKKLFLGGGSNLLLSKAQFSGMVVNTHIQGIQKIKEDKQHVWLKVGAGENWHPFVQNCITQGYFGLENLSYIPGTVGAAPIQNIGAYGVEIKEFLESVEYFNLQKNTLETLANHECQFAYRDSIFKHDLKDQCMITSVIVKLNKTENFRTEYGEIQNVLKQRNIRKLSAKIISDVITDIRKQKLADPAQFPNAGSFFKNPIIPLKHFKTLKEQHPEIPHYPINQEQIKIPAAWLIEKIAWKGKKIGNVGTYPNQPLVIVNYNGKGTGEEIKEFANYIQKNVKETFAIQLTPEVRIIS